MARRFHGNGPIASVANVQTVESILLQVRSGFQPKQNPFNELAREIEKSSRKIWQCVGDKDPSWRHAKKARTSKPVDAPSQEAPKSPYRSEQVSSNGLSRFKFETELNAMKYQDLRNECKKYGLKCAGTKAVLRNKLIGHIFGDNTGGDFEETDEQMEVEEVDEESKLVQDTIMDDAPKFIKEKGLLEPVEAESVVEAEPARISSSSMQAHADGVRADFVEVQAELVESEVAHEQRSKDPPGKLILEKQTGKHMVPQAASNAKSPLIGASKTKSPVIGASKAKSPLAGLMKNALQSLSHSTQNSHDCPAGESIPEDDTSPPPSDFTSSTTSSKMGPRVRELISSLSNQTGSTSSALSKSVQAKKEARLARMAEMRVKSQQAKILSGSNPAISATKEYLGTSAGTTSGAKKNLATQMREKALRKENAPANHNLVAPSNNAPVKRAFPLPNAAVVDSLGTTLKSGLGPGLNYGESAAKKVKALQQPSDTYEISDREDSESDDSEEENQKNKKKIPSWAQKEKLVAALKTQYNGHIEGRRVDPDVIFAEVETCNLEAIFGNKLNSKYRTRTSSGNWSKDQVTAAEKLIYKREMGFAGK